MLIVEYVGIYQKRMDSKFDQFVFTKKLNEERVQEKFSKSI